MKEIIIGVIIGSILAVGGTFLLYERRITKLESTKVETVALTQTNNNLQGIISRVEYLERTKGIFSIQELPSVGEHDKRETYELGTYDFCYLSAVNEAERGNSACILSKKDSKWFLYATYANCRAICMKLTEKN